MPRARQWGRPCSSGLSLGAPTFRHLTCSTAWKLSEPLSEGFLELPAHGVQVIKSLLTGSPHPPHPVYLPGKEFMGRPSSAQSLSLAKTLEWLKEA